MVKPTIPVVLSSPSLTVSSTWAFSALLGAGASAQCMAAAAVMVMVEMLDNVIDGGIESESERNQATDRARAGASIYSVSCA